MEEHRGYQFLVKLVRRQLCVGRISSQAGNALLCLLSWLSEVWELKPHELTLDSELPPLETCAQEELGKAMPEQTPCC